MRYVPYNRTMGLELHDELKSSPRYRHWAASIPGRYFFAPPPLPTYFGDSWESVGEDRPSIWDDMDPEY